MSTPIWRLVIPLTIALLSSSCKEGQSPPEPERQGPGLIYSYPADGQVDVPTGSIVSLLFSGAVDTGKLTEECQLTGEQVSGALCLVGPIGVVAGQWALVGGQEQAVEFEPTEPLESRQEYRVHVDGALLSAGIGNLDPDGIAARFTTHGERPLAESEAELIWVNGDAPQIFATGSVLQPRFPLMDFATFRLVFSEPIEERSAVLGTTVEFIEIAADGSESLVAGQLLAGGVHLSFDPDEDLNAEHSYQLRLNAGLVDLGGQAIAPQTLVFAPEASAAAGELYRQVLDVAPGLGEQDFPSLSAVASLAGNQVSLKSGLIGQEVISLKDGNIEVELAHPERFATTMPFVIRKGQSMTASGLDISIAGVVNSGLSTGDLKFSFATDLTGTITRNQHWPQNRLPDDIDAPLQVFLDFDLAISAVDPVGNAVLTQTLLGVHAVGVARAKDGQLQLSTLATLEVDLLGIGKVTSRIVLSFATTVAGDSVVDGTPPTLVSTSPTHEGYLSESGDSVTLTFSEGVELRNDEAIVLQNSALGLVQADLRVSGSTVIITPLQAFEEDEVFRVLIGGGLVDLSGNSWSSEASDPTAGSGVYSFNTGRLSSASSLPPALLSVYPGAPCAMSDGRQCIGGIVSDDDYLDFGLPSNHDLKFSFDQAMKRESVALGSACDQGAVRVEEVSAKDCLAVVPGTLLVGQRSVRFVPSQPWQEGSSYRLSLVGGDDGECDAGEVCGINALPFNTDLLNGADRAGGPKLNVYFGGTPASSAFSASTGLVPRADLNGNAVIDDGERESESNRAVVRIADTSGVVTSASIAMTDCDASTEEIEGCMHLTSDLVVLLEQEQSNCQIPSASGTINAEHCIPLTIQPAMIYGSELLMDANLLGLGLVNELSTGKLAIRLRQSGQPIRGYIVEDASGNPEMILPLSTYMDAPDLEIFGGLASHDLFSKSVELALRGPVSFQEDGRLKIILKNETEVRIDVSVGALGIGGVIGLEIKAGAMQLDFMSSPARGGLR